MTKAEKKTRAARIAAIELIASTNRLEEKELQAMLAPLDSRLTVLIFGTNNPFEWEVSVGYNGKNNYQLGERFRIGLNPLNLRPFVTREEYNVDFEEAEQNALDWLRYTTAVRIMNHFQDRPDRILKAVDPLEWYKKHGA